MPRSQITCQRTGCDVYLRDYSAIIHGDAYADADNNILIIRTRSQPQRVISGNEIVQYVVEDHDQWFDRYTDNSIIIATKFKYVSYEGKSINEAFS